MNDDHLKALGRVVVNFNSLEVFLNFLIWILIGPDLKTGKIITSEVSFKGKITLLASLYRIKIKDIKKDSDVNGLIKRLIKAEDERNKVIHSSWVIDEKNTRITRYKITAKLKRGLKDEFEEMNDTDINKIADSINDVAKEIGNMISSYPQGRLLK